MSVAKHDSGQPKEEGPSSQKWEMHIDEDGMTISLPDDLMTALKVDTYDWVRYTPVREKGKVLGVTIKRIEKPKRRSKWVAQVLPIAMETE